MRPPRPPGDHGPRFFERGPLPSALSGNGHPPSPVRQSGGHSLTGPWFALHPAAAGVVIVALFAAVTTLRVLASGPDDATTLLYALPVALAAMSWGRVGGTTASVTSIVLLVAWVLGQHDIVLSPLGWAARTLPLILLGVLVGEAADAAARASRERLRLAVIEEQRRSAAEVNDTILQYLAVAKWQLEAGAVDAAGELLETAMRDGQRLVRDLLAPEGAAKLQVRRNI